MLDNASYTDEIGRRLYAVTAEFARIAGLRALDSDHQASAQRYFMTGLRAAHTSGDRAIGANILTFNAHAGLSALALGKPRQAEAHYRDALARVAPAFPRDRLGFLGRLALARVRLRELDGACRAATEAGALLRRFDSPRKRAQLAEFRKAAQPYANTTQIKEFDAKFGDLVRPIAV